MRVKELLLSFGLVILASTLVSATPQDTSSKKNLTNIRERLPEMVAQLNAMAYEEFSEESSRSMEDTSSTSTKQQFKRLASAEEGVEYQNYQGVMGRPGVDFPVLPSIPRTDFTCKKVKSSGYYADLDTDCQVFHICDQGRKISFLCPNGTIFRQSHLICDWWWTVDCGSSVDHYDSSAEQLAHDQKAYKALSDKKIQDADRKRTDTTTTSNSRRNGVNLNQNEPQNGPTSSPQFSTTSINRNRGFSQGGNNRENDDGRAQSVSNVQGQRQGKNVNVGKENNRVYSQQQPTFQQNAQQYQQKDQERHQQSQNKQELPTRRQQSNQQSRGQQNIHGNQQNQGNNQQFQQNQRQGQNTRDNGSETTTSQPRGLVKNYNNIRFNYGTTAGDQEHQVPAESASFVNNKNQFSGGRQNQFIQSQTPKAFEYPSSTQSPPSPRFQEQSNKQYVELDRINTPFTTYGPTTTEYVRRSQSKNGRGPSQPQPSDSNSFPKLTKLIDEDFLRIRGRGPPTNDFYRSTTTEVVPITDVEEPSGRPFTSEDVTRDNSELINKLNNLNRDYVNFDRSRTTTDSPASTLSIALSQKVKPVYIQVTTREGRVATSTTELPEITDVVSPSGEAFTEEEVLAKALATLGPNLNIKYATTTEYGQITDVVQPAGVPFRDEDFGTYKPFVREEPPKPSITELPPIKEDITTTLEETYDNQESTTEPSQTELPPIFDVVKPTGTQFTNEDIIINRISEYEDVPTEIPSLTETSPIIDDVKSEGPSFTNEEVYTITDGPVEVETTQATDIPSIFDIVRPTGAQFTIEDKFSNKANSGFWITKAPPKATSKPSATYVEYDRVSKEVRFVTPESPPSTSDTVKIRADVLHGAIDDIVHRSSLNSVFKEILTTSPDEPKRKPFGRGSKTTTTTTTTQAPFKSRGVPRRFQQTSIDSGTGEGSTSTTPLPLSSSESPSYDQLATTLLPPELYDNVITYTTFNKSLNIDNSNRDPITVQPADENVTKLNNGRVNGDRTGLEIPTSSGPAVLHSLAVYFGNKGEGPSTEPTQPDIPHKEEIQLREYSNDSEPSLDTQTITEDPNEVLPSILTQFTKDSYEALFPETRKVKIEDNNIAGEILQREGSSSNGFKGNDLRDNTSEIDNELKRTTDSADLRELAQVFSRALSAYLEDPEEFRKVLSEVRPTPPTESTTHTTEASNVNGTTQYSDREEDEVLEYSDDSKVHKRPVIKNVYTKQDQNKNSVNSILTTDRKGRVLTSGAVSVSNLNEQSTVRQIQSDEIADPTRLPFETLERSQSSYYSDPIQSITGNKIASELVNDSTAADEGLTDYNLPPGTVQYNGSRYGPQAGDVDISTTDSVVSDKTAERFGGLDDNISQLEETTTTNYETTTEVPYTNSTTTQENAEGTTIVQSSNQYDGYIIPVLDTELAPPPFKEESYQNIESTTTERENVAAPFHPQEINNLAILNVSEDYTTTEREQQTTTEPQSTTVEGLPTTTETLPTTTEEIRETTVIPLTTEVSPSSELKVEQIFTTTASPQTVRFNVKEDRRGRRISFSRNSEVGESLVRANTASFTSSRANKDTRNQWNTIGRFESVQDVKYNQKPSNEETPSSTYRPRSTSRPVVRRRFKTTTEVTEAPSIEKEFYPTNSPSYQESESTSRSAGIIERRLRTSTEIPITTPEFVTPKTVTSSEKPKLQRKYRPPTVKSDEIVYGTKESKQSRRFKSTTQQVVSTSEAITEAITTSSSIPPTYLPTTTTTTTTETPEKMPMAMEAKMMFGNLNESSINHLMDVMKMAESNSTVRRLVLLLVNHGPQNKSTEESRRNLIEALLTTPNEIPMPEALQADHPSELQQINATTSMKVSMTVGKSSRSSSRRGKTLIGSSVRMTMNEVNNKETTTTQVPVTTFRNNGKRVAYKVTVPSTTKKSSDIKKSVPTTPATTTDMQMSVSSSNSSTITTKRSFKRREPSESVATPGALTEESDNRAVDLLRSLYSLAARWG